MTVKHRSLPVGTDRPLRLVDAQARPSPVARHDDLARLARGVAQHDKAAIRTFLVTVGPHLLQVVRRVLGASHPDVEDVAQECAVAVIEALPRYRGESTVLHFTCRVAMMTAMNVRRRESAQKRPGFCHGGVAVEEIASESPLPDAELTARASLRAVRELIETLPIAQAEVLALHCVLGYTVSEIAEACQIPMETVRSRLRLSRNALREKVSDAPLIREAVEDWS